MRWTPETFWRATPHEFLAMVDGWVWARTGKHPRGDGAGLGRGEVAALRSQLDDALRAEGRR